MAVVGVDAELADNLAAVLAPVIDVDQRVVERRGVIAGEVVDAAKGFGGGKGVGVMTSSRSHWNSGSVNLTRLSDSNISRRSFSTVARSRVSCRIGTSRH
jgi:hypothetical protein